MLRIAGSVIAGYCLMVLLVFIGLTAAWMVLGADGAFEPARYQVSLAWLGVSIAVGFGAALAGGWVARRIAGTAHGPRMLAGVVAVLGVVMALPVLFGSALEPVARAATVTMFEAMQQAQTPLWAMLLNPVIGAVGALVGGRALGDAPAAATVPTVTA